MAELERKFGDSSDVMGLFRGLVGIFSWKNILHSLCLFYTYNLVASLLLVDGVSAIFAKRAADVSGVILVCLVIFVFAFRRQIHKLPHTRGDQYMGLSLTVLLLLPLTPILRYVLLNQDTLKLWESVVFFTIHLVIAALLIIFFPYLLRNRINPSVSIVIGIALSFFYFNMPVLSVENNWYGQGEFPVQAIIFTVIFIVISLLYHVRKDFIYPVIVAFFVLNVIQVVAFEKKLEFVSFSNNEVTFSLEDRLKVTPLVKKPDIYLLTYDSYVSNDVLAEYGIDNLVQENFLRKMGFTIYEGTYSKGFDSLDSMSQMLNMTEYEGIVDRRIATSGNSSVVRILKAQDYKTYSFIGQYFFGPIRSSYDLTELGATFKTSLPFLLRAMAEGQFRFDVQKPDKPVMILGKRGIFHEDTNSPKFLYNHTGPGHSQNSGKCRSNEIDLYRQRVEEANREMRDDIKAIKSRSRDAIIIINGDHGPYLLGDCSFLPNFDRGQISRALLQDRFGAFLAIHWPEGIDGPEFNQIKTVQEVFPAIFSLLYDDIEVWDARPGSRTHEKLHGVYIDNGIIKGGSDNGELLFQ